MPEPPRDGFFDRLDRFFDTLIPPTEQVAALARRGEVLLESGDARGALAMADGALEVSPQYLRALLLRADALAGLGRHREALGELEQQTRLRALPPFVYARLAGYAAQAGDEALALRWESQARGRARERDPEAGRRLLEAARTLAAQGLSPGVVRLARGATAVDPHLGEAWLLLAQDALRRGDSGQALRLLERASGNLRSTDARANREAGALALALGDPRRAATLLRRAWIGGEESSLPPLVVALGRLGEHAALERVMADASGMDAHIARALLRLSRGEEGAEAAFSELRAGMIPEALWPLALDSALQHAPLLAERWCRQEPLRPGASPVAALGVARERLQGGDDRGAQEALGPALADPRTRGAALALHKDCLRARWRGRVALALEELAVLVRGAPGGAELQGELRARRRELDEPLRVAILGEFSAGKSTFLNALVGAEVSPMGVLPTTAQVHWLRAGDPQARIVDAAGTAVLATVEEAPRVVSRMREGGKDVQYVEVTLPVARLGRVELIDTPGFNAGDDGHELAVRRAFDLADVALWLFDARQAGKSSEVGPLQEARAQGIAVLGVLNKWDQVRPQERAALWRVLTRGVGELAPMVCAVSAREALRATLAAAKDPSAQAPREALEASGLAGLVAYLDEHLVGQRTAWKAVRVAAKVRPSLALAREGVEASQRERREREERRAELGRALQHLREGVEEAASLAREEVALVLKEQLAGLEGRKEARKQLDALVSDALAEVGYRVRQRALDALAPRLAAVEKGAVASGLLTEGAARLCTAPVVQLLEQAVAEGVRDALQGPPRARYLPSDPLVALERALGAWSEQAREDGGELLAALEVAEELLGALPAPVLEPAKAPV